MLDPLAKDKLAYLRTVGILLPLIAIVGAGAWLLGLFPPRVSITVLSAMMLMVGYITLDITKELKKLILQLGSDLKDENRIKRLFVTQAQIERRLIELAALCREASEVCIDYQRERVQTRSEKREIRIGELLSDQEVALKSRMDFFFETARLFERQGFEVLRRKSDNKLSYKLYLNDDEEKPMPAA